MDKTTTNSPWPLQLVQHLVIISLLHKSNLLPCKTKPLYHSFQAIPTYNLTPNRWIQAELVSLALLGVMLRIQVQDSSQGREEHAYLIGKVQLDRDTHSKINSALKQSLYLTPSKAKRDIPELNSAGILM